MEALASVSKCAWTQKDSTNRLVGAQQSPLSDSSVFLPEGMQ